MTSFFVKQICRPANWALLATCLLPGCGRMHKEAFEKVPLARGQIEVVRLSEESNLYVDRVRFWSDEMNEPRLFLALIPKAPAVPKAHAPDSATQPFRPSEVFILNHGWSDRPEFLLRDLHVDKVYNEMLGQGKVRPAILVMPDVRFAGFYTEVSDRYPFPNYLTLVAEEVAGTVSKRYGIPFDRACWSIGGFSFGGYLSLDIGRRYPGRFASVSVISGFHNSEWTYWPADPPPPGHLDEKGRGRQTVIVPGPVPRLFLACGTDDRLYRSMLALHEMFTGLKIQHQWWTGPGGHTWKTWSAALPVMLEFALGNPPASQPQQVGRGQLQAGVVPSPKPTS